MCTCIDWCRAEELNVDPAEVHGEAEAEPGEADEAAAEAPARAAAVAEAGQARDELGRSGCDQTLATWANCGKRLLELQTNVHTKVRNHEEGPY